QKGVSLLFTSEDSEKRLQEKLRICPFSGSKEEQIAYTEKLEEQLRENIVEQIHPEHAKWFNPTFIIPKPHSKWWKILEASALNKQIQTIHFKMNETDQVRDLIRKGDWATSLDLKSAFHHLKVYPPHRPYLAFEAMGKVYQYRAMPFGTQHYSIFFTQALANGSNEDTERVRYKNSELRRRSARLIFEQRKIAKINFDNNKNFGSIWLDNIVGKMRNRTKTTDQLARINLELGEDAQKDDTPKKTRTKLLIKEIYQPNIETNPDQNKISSFNNRQAEFFKSRSKRSFPLLKTNGLSKNECIEKQGMDREYDFTQRNTSRSILVAGSDSEKLRDDIRSENSRSSNGIRCIPERLESDSGTSNRGYFSPTWRMEQGTEEVDKQQEGDGSHILRTKPLQISLQRAANQSDPHQVRQLYHSIRFSKTKIRRDSSSKSEENSQTMPTTENTNTYSTYSGNLKQDNRRTKQVECPGRLFSKERNVHSPLPSVGDNTNTGLVRNSGKQIRGQVRSNRRGRGRGRMV
ncbi:MAG: hypothetical protein EZS28_043505, partial [Streblomastix strix]